MAGPLPIEKFRSGLCVHLRTSSHEVAIQVLQRTCSSPSSRWPLGRTCVVSSLDILWDPRVRIYVVSRCVIHNGSGLCCVNSPV